MFGIKENEKKGGQTPSIPAEIKQARAPSNQAISNNSIQFILEMVQCQQEIKRGEKKGSVCTKKAIQSGEYAGKYCAGHAKQLQDKELRDQARKEDPNRFASGESRKGVKTGSTAYSVYISEKAKEWKVLKDSKDTEDQARVKEYERRAKEKNSENEEKNASSSSSDSDE